MIPIQDILNRIRWDENFGTGNFLIGYEDRMAGKIITVSFQKILFPPGDHFFIQVVSSDQERISIPYHRIRQVWKNGVIIWQR